MKKDIYVIGVMILLIYMNMFFHNPILGFLAFSLFVVEIGIILIETW